MSRRRHEKKIEKNGSLGTFLRFLKVMTQKKSALYYAKQGKQNQPPFENLRGWYERRHWGAGVGAAASGCSACTWRRRDARQRLWHGSTAARGLAAAARGSTAAARGGSGTRLGDGGTQLGGAGGWLTGDLPAKARLGPGRRHTSHTHKTHTPPHLNEVNSHRCVLTKSTMTELRWAGR